MMFFINSPGKPAETTNNFHMKQFLAFVRKEFAHVIRDRKTLLILFGMPVVQILIFGFALTNEVKNTSILIVDHAKDMASQQLITKIEASQYFEVKRSILSPREIDKAFQEGIVRVALIFPVGFNESLKHENSAKLQFLADASDPNTATTLTNYLGAIIEDYQSANNALKGTPFTITTDTRMLYNP